jgi:fumarate reductase (CoM/CoB) subunit A
LERLECDVLVIGSGAAGLRSAISAAQRGCRVLVVSKGAPGMATSTILSGGAFRGAEEGGDPEEHREITLQAGRGINDARLLDVLVREGPGRLQELVAWGIRGLVRGGFLFANGRAPVWGEEIVRCLLERARAMGVQFLGSIAVQRIIPGRGAWGVLGHSSVREKWMAFCSGAVVLATGGAGALYVRHDNPRRMLGDGYALAWEAGARLQDMEFVQFYPFGVAEPGFPSYLIPPRLADRGNLANDRGEEIYSKYGIHERPAGEKARDRLSQALFREIYREGRTIRLDLRGALNDDWSGDLLSMSGGQLLGDRCHAEERPLGVAPMAHFTMGGVCIDTEGRTSLPGLFAAGEVAGGLHGANRLGGNALTETLVFGARAGEAAASWAEGAQGTTGEKVCDDLQRSIPTSQPRSSPGRSSGLKKRLRDALWQEGGILRSRDGLQWAASVVEEILEAIHPGVQSPDPSETQRLLELRLATQTARLILEAAMRREESRGAHFREDFPEQDDERWAGHLTVSMSPEGKETWSFVPASLPAQP